MVSKLLTVVLTTMFVFALFGYGSISPASNLCEQLGNCTQEREARIEESLGLDEPVTVQYAEWAKGLFVDRTISVGTGADYECPAPCLGISYNDYQPVREEIVSRFPATLSIAGGGAAIALVVGLTLGSLAARYRGRVVDRGLVITSLLVSAVPFYIVALVAWLYLVNAYGVFPETGYFPISDDPLRWASGMLLPWLVLGIYSCTTYARYSRAEMITALGEDYVRTATAKGLSRRRVLVRHSLRAAIVPVVTIFGLDLAGLLTGTIFLEQIFGVDGVGLYTIGAITSLDYPVISAMVLIAAVVLVVSTFVVDLLYSVLDPRVRLT